MFKKGEYQSSEIGNYQALEKPWENYQKREIKQKLFRYYLYLWFSAILQAHARRTFSQSKKCSELK